MIGRAAPPKVSPPSIEVIHPFFSIDFQRQMKMVLNGFNITMTASSAKFHFYEYRSLKNVIKDPFENHFYEYRSLKKRIVFCLRNEKNGYRDRQYNIESIKNHFDLLRPPDLPESSKGIVKPKLTAVNSNIFARTHARAREVIFREVSFR